MYFRQALCLRCVRVVKFNADYAFIARKRICDMSVSNRVIKYPTLIFKKILKCSTVVYGYLLNAVNFAQSTHRKQRKHLRFLRCVRCVKSLLLHCLGDVPP